MSSSVKMTILWRQRHYNNLLFIIERCLYMIITNPLNQSEIFDTDKPRKKGRPDKWISDHPQYKEYRKSRGYKTNDNKTPLTPICEEGCDLISKEDLKIAVSRRILAKNNTNFTDPEDFILNCYASVNPQSYGALIEQRIRDKNNMTKISNRLEEGDVLSSNPDDPYPKKEVKASISEKGEFRIVQTRPNSGMNSYLLLFFEITSHKPEDMRVVRHTFEVPKKELEDFVGIASAHGHAKQDNEGALTIKIGSSNWELLNKNYKTTQYNF